MKKVKSIDPEKVKINPKELEEALRKAMTTKPKKKK